MKQKLVTVFLHDRVDGKKAYGDPAGNPLFGVSEHLESYLKEGWLVKSVQTMGGAGDTSPDGSSRCWKKRTR